MHWHKGCSVYVRVWVYLLTDGVRTWHSGVRSGGEKGSMTGSRSWWGTCEERDTKEKTQRDMQRQRGKRTQDGRQQIGRDTQTNSPPVSHFLSSALEFKRVRPTLRNVTRQPPNPITQITCFLHVVIIFSISTVLYNDRSRPPFSVQAFWIHFGHTEGGWEWK